MYKFWVLALIGCLIATIIGVEISNSRKTNEQFEKFFKEETKKISEEIESETDTVGERGVYVDEMSEDEIFGNVESHFRPEGTGD